jgi:hypothetical protein
MAVKGSKHCSVEVLCRILRRLNKTTATSISTTETGREPNQILSEYMYFTIEIILSAKHEVSSVNYTMHRTYIKAGISLKLKKKKTPWF